MIYINFFIVLISNFYFLKNHHMIDSAMNNINAIEKRIIIINQNCNFLGFQVIFYDHD